MLNNLKPKIENRNKKLDETLQFCFLKPHFCGKNFRICSFESCLSINILVEIFLVKLQNLKNSKLVAQTNKYRPGFYEWFHFNLSIAIDQIYKWQKFCVAKPSSLFSRISVEKQFNFLNILKLKKTDKFCGKLNHDS